MNNEKHEETLLRQGEEEFLDDKTLDELVAYLRDWAACLENANPEFYPKFKKAAQALCDCSGVVAEVANELVTV